MAKKSKKLSSNKSNESVEKNPEPGTLQQVSDWSPITEAHTAGSALTGGASQVTEHATAEYAALEEVARLSKQEAIQDVARRVTENEGAEHHC